MRPHNYLEPPQPLSPAFFLPSSAGFSVALPAPSFSAAQPLPDVAQPERVMLPAPIKLTMPMPARSFFTSSLFMFSSLELKSVPIAGANELLQKYSLMLSKFDDESQGKEVFSNHFDRLFVDRY